MAIKKNIENYLQDIKFKNLDQEYISSEDYELNYIKNSNVIRNFLVKYKRNYIDLDNEINKTYLILSKKERIKRKDFYSTLFLKSIDNKLLEINY